MASQAESPGASQDGAKAPTAEDLRTAVVAETKFWLLAAVGLVAAWYISNSGIPGEAFYVFLAVSFAVVAVAWGFYDVRRRMTLFA